MYIYALKQLGHKDIIEKLFFETVKEEEKFIKDITEDDEECKEYQITNALKKISEYENGYRKVKNDDIIKNYYSHLLKRIVIYLGA